MEALSCRLGRLQRAAFMPTVTVLVEGVESNTQAKMLALTDGASSGLILTRRAAKKLKLPTFTDSVTIGVVTASVTKTCDLARIRLRSLYDGELKDNGGEVDMTAVLVDHIPILEGSVGTPNAAAQYPYMADVTIVPPPSSKWTSL